MSRRICISGEIGAGKTTIADYLVTLGFTELSFAAKLKEVASIILGVPLEYLDGRQYREERESAIIEPWNLTGRQALIAIGEMFRDNFNPDTWIIALGNLPDGDVVISDVRKDNEKKYTHEHGFVHIYVTKTELLHKSEYDFVIVNDSTKEDLYRKVDNFLDTFIS